MFECTVSQDSIPTFEVLFRFVQQRCKVLENIKESEKSDTRLSKTKHSPTSRSALIIATAKNTSTVYRQSLTQVEGPNKVVRIANGFISYIDVKHRVLTLTALVFY
ncbi:unnamed protein product [Macrosiphum euphorbiae]|uniref:Uncharacterized protein n=1 Tax=Macrosiphum euphorbiae TaxID=13131 RepID=A0AAV0XUY5_9HEMI|nr:unnamed protein product [Macrosiphum euphorbiae]